MRFRNKIVILSISHLIRLFNPFLCHCWCSSFLSVSRKKDINSSSRRVAHGEINVFDGANFITITVTRIIKLCDCSVVCLPSATKRVYAKNQPVATDYLDRHKKSQEASSFLFKRSAVQFLAKMKPSFLLFYHSQCRPFLVERHVLWLRLINDKET